MHLQGGGTWDYTNKGGIKQYEGSYSGDIAAEGANNLSLTVEKAARLPLQHILPIQPLRRKRGSSSALLEKIMGTSSSIFLLGLEQMGILSPVLLCVIGMVQVQWNAPEVTLSISSKQPILLSSIYMIRHTIIINTNSPAL